MSGADTLTGTPLRESTIESPEETSLTESASSVNLSGQMYISQRRTGGIEDKLTKKPA
jgi:hypothetical protein